jgi:class 3 adenylate cyclase
VRCASLAEASSVTALKESSFFRDYLAPLYIHDMLVANAAPCAGIFMNLTVSRGPRESPFGAPERSKLIAIIEAVSSRFEQKLLSQRQKTTCTAADTVLMVTDMVDFTGLVRRAGDVRARAVVRRHNELMRASFARHDGREVAHTGDGFIAAFGNERDAVACGRAIHRWFDELEALSGGESLRIRIGIHAGPVLEEEGRLFGAALIIAVRICSNAGPGQLLISEQVLERLDRQTRANARPMGATALKGFAEPAVLYEIARYRSATSFVIARIGRS